MTTKERNTKLSAAEVVRGDRDLIKALMKEALQAVLEGEMTEFPGVTPGERTEARTGYRSGYHGRSLITRIGKLELRIPPDRGGGFPTGLFERHARSEKALVAALAEMYVQGRRRLPPGVALDLRPARPPASPARPVGAGRQMASQVPEAGRLGRGQHQRNADLLPVAARAPQPPAECQYAGAAQRGDRAQNPDFM